MFYTPIRHTPLKSLSDVLNFSCHTRRIAKKPNTFFQKDSDIIICNEDSNVFITPFREEIPMILKEFGFKQEYFECGFLSPPLFLSKSYFILEEMAKREKQLKIYEENFEKSKKKNLEDIPFPENLDFNMREIFCSETVGCSPYYKINPLFSGNDENCNLCTFIILKNKYLFICDEYGRSFCLSFGSIDDLSPFVNFLFDSGYTYTIHPEKYISKSE